MAALDAEKVLAHLEWMRRHSHSQVVLAYVDGLEIRTRRGDFDLELVPA